MPEATAASDFLSMNNEWTMNEIHSSISFTIEAKTKTKFLSLGIKIIQNGSQLDIKVYKKPLRYWLTILHFQGHLGVRYKHSLLRTMLNREFKLSLYIYMQLCHQEYERLKENIALYIQNLLCKSKSKTLTKNYKQHTQYMNSHTEAFWWFALIQEPFNLTKDFLYSAECCISLISPNTLCNFPLKCCS